MVLFVLRAGLDDTDRYGASVGVSGLQAAHKQLLVSCRTPPQCGVMAAHCGTERSPVFLLRDGESRHTILPQLRGGDGETKGGEAMRSKVRDIVGKLFCAAVFFAIFGGMAILVGIAERLLGV